MLCTAASQTLQNTAWSSRAGEVGCLAVLILLLLLRECLVALLIEGAALWHRYSTWSDMHAQLAAEA